MSFGPWQLLIIGALVLVLFGRGRISEMMGDVGKGIKSFKKGLSEEEMDEGKKDTPPAQLDNNSNVDIKSAEKDKA